MRIQLNSIVFALTKGQRVHVNKLEEALLAGSTARTAFASIK